MTSVPKPLKFLRDQYDTLKATYDKLEGENKSALADIISWLGMTLGFETRDCLNYKLKGTKEGASSWGHEYVRHLSMEIGNEYDERVANGVTDLDDLIALIDEIVPFLATHNAEPEACDLLLEVDMLSRILNHVSEQNYKRIVLYLHSCANYLPEPEDKQTLQVILSINLKMERAAEALFVALALDDHEQISSIYEAAEGSLRKQLALILGDHCYYNLVEDEDDEELQELMGNVKRSNWFQNVLGKDLDVLDPKLPEEIYKTDISGDKKKLPAKTDSARNNLAATFVNAFVNAGFSRDKLMTEGADGAWLFKNREHGRISAAASVGLICLWDPDSSNEVDKYSYTKDEFVKAGVMLGVGITNVNVRTPFDVAFALIAENIADETPLVQQCSSLALGLAYAGSSKEHVRETLLEIYDDAPTLEVLAHVALSLGFVEVGTCDPELTELFVTSLVEKGMEENGLDSPFARYLCLALGMLYLGKQERAAVALAALGVVKGPMGKYAVMTVETCAYVGTGDVLKIQQLLSVCGEHGEEADSIHQAVAVLGVALVSMREPIGRAMAIRSFDHLLQYGEPNVRRAVPLALGLLSLCTPDISIMDTLSKFSHDHNADVAMSAIIGLGLIGAGSNNSRIAQLLRGLASYYAKEPNQLFIVRFAQGLLHMGKGTLTISPFHADSLLVRPTAMAGLLAFLHTCFDVKGLVLGKAHYLLYTLSLAMSPRMLMLVDENLEPVASTVRVGAAVDVVGKAGNPKTITGFQTHNSPVLLGSKDRAELGTDEEIPLSPILEGVVITKPNPASKSKGKKLTSSAAGTEVKK
eukprot:TRINITY_DN1846_c0_g1_i1.p1 TRINITY_DN1846_c0_g1~~TRINITY_DN1846_c0_g1_i1.p1  ORF type:complete len:917 (-),score=265.52 TRINITY_DN1846_c0_g1_i1:19-2457(-)